MMRLSNRSSWSCRCCSSSGTLTTRSTRDAKTALMQRLRDVREWRERLGMATAGGPVRVARETGDDG